MAEVIGTAEYLLTANVDGLKSGVKEAESILQKGVEAAGNAASESENSISKMSVATSALIGSAVDKGFNVAVTGIKNFATSAFDVATSFEAGMDRVAAISGATGSDFDALTEKAKEMGRTTKYSATDAADAMSYMAMAGWKTDDMLNGIDGMMTLAAASGADLATTSDIVTDALTGFGLSAQDANHFADVLAATSSNANTNVELMGETFKYVSPLAGALGYSVEDVSTAIGLMANAGIKGSQAGTSLRSIMTRLSTDTSGAATALAELGVEIKNADGSMRPLGNVMEDMREAFAGLSEEEKVTLASTVAGTEGMSGLLAIVNAAPEDFEKLTSAIANSDGAAQEMADTMSDNVQGKIATLRSKVEDLMIRAFEALQPAIEGVIEALGWAADNADKLIPVIGVVGAALVGLKVVNFAKNLSGVAGVVKTVGTAFSKSLLPVLSNMASTLITKVIPAVFSFGAALLANPITWIVIGITAVIAAIVLLIANFDKVKEVAGAVFSWIGNFIGGIANGISQAFQASWDFIAGLFGGIGDFFAGVFQGAVDAIMGVFEGIGNFFKGVWDTIVGIFTGIGTVIGNAVSGAFKSVVNGVLSFIESFINGPINVLNGFIDVINGAFGWAGVNLGRINGVSLPRMYTGGIVPGSGAGMPIIAGDGGEDEFIVPESKMASLIDQIEARGGTGGDTFNFTFNGVLGTPSEMRELAIVFHDKYEEVKKARFQ